ncbi:MAG: isoaspartyl peptidase/L-asparaginase [Verrucomicrobiota bacterium]
MQEAVRAGYKALHEKKDSDHQSNMTPALKAVLAAVAVMEDRPAFNCGLGSVLNEDGRVEMDASVMDGDLRYGAVGSISDVKNAVHVAGKVLTDSEHCFFAGEGAKRFALRHGFEELEPGALETSWAREALELAKKEGTGMQHEIGGGETGTVGAVAIDAEGNLAAATSTDLAGGGRLTVVQPQLDAAFRDAEKSGVKPPHSEALRAEIQVSHIEPSFSSFCAGSFGHFRKHS